MSARLRILFIVVILVGLLTAAGPAAAGGRPSPAAGGKPTPAGVA